MSRIKKKNWRRTTLLSKLINPEKSSNPVNPDTDNDRQQTHLQNHRMRYESTQQNGIRISRSHLPTLPRH
jgi:hypothetical protein